MKVTSYAKTQNLAPDPRLRGDKRKIGGQLTYAELVTTCPLISHEGLFELSTNTNSSYTQVTTLRLSWHTMSE